MYFLLPAGISVSPLSENRFIILSFRFKLHMMVKIGVRAVPELSLKTFPPHFFFLSNYSEAEFPQKCLSYLKGITS